MAVPQCTPLIGGLQCNPYTKLLFHITQTAPCNRTDTAPRIESGKRDRGLNSANPLLPRLNLPTPLHSLFIFLSHPPSHFTMVSFFNHPIVQSTICLSLEFNFLDPSSHLLSLTIPNHHLNSSNSYNISLINNPLTRSQ